MRETRDAIIGALRAKGVEIPAPDTVFIGPEVKPARISGEGVSIHPGCRIRGGTTLIMRGAQIGREGPATVEDCHIGPGVELGGGCFRMSTFLDGASVGPAAHVREGCILEEDARAAHAVGLKQTILFPFVTLGSLVNFCDCLMAGGTARREHSEVGSSYVHFNFTPQGDKATPSLVGDVPAGVMLDRPPIFLGGQGGLVGPARIGYGTVIAAGTVYRGDCPGGGMLIFGDERKRGSGPFEAGVYREIRRRTLNNVNYIANLAALRQWYLHVRSPFGSGDEMRRALIEGAILRIEEAVEERIRRLGEMVARLPASAAAIEAAAGTGASPRLIERKRELVGRWEEIKGVLASARDREGDASLRDLFTAAVSASRKEANYIQAVKGLEPRIRRIGTDWLRGIVDEINEEVLALLPSFRS